MNGPNIPMARKAWVTPAFSKADVKAVTKQGPANNHADGPNPKKS